MTADVLMKSPNLIGHIKFRPWQQLDGCSMSRPFLSVKGVACEPKAKGCTAEINFLLTTLLEHVYLVLEPDSRKIEKEGLAYRPGRKCTLWNVRNFINC